MKQRLLSILAVMLMTLTASAQTEHEYVDLGLPSGTLWATCNVGANSPEEYGDYFAWGETKPKTDYSWDTYFDTDDGGKTFKKYYDNDGLTELLPEDDAATVNWGSKWHTPSVEQCSELINDKYTTIEWTKQTKVLGHKITSKTNGKSIFLPACGSLGKNSTHCDTGRTIYSTRSVNYEWAKFLFSEGYGADFYVVGFIRYGGFPVRPVREPDTPILIVKSIELSLTSVSLLIDETRTITAKVQPATAANKNVIWSSSNSSVATVDQDGNVTGKAIGSCTITCSATDSSGEKSECQVTVAKFNYETIDGREYVDFGLPSGTLWATCNVGAESPEEFGDYFAWGETEPKSDYSWSTYKYGHGSYQLTKYCPSNEWGYNGFTDSLTELELEDDAATVNWGSEWQTPNIKQTGELIDYKYTTQVRTTYKGVNGYKITSKSNGNCIFLPDAGRYEGTNLCHVDKGCFWTRSLRIDNPYSAYYTYAWSIYYSTSRSGGLSVRPVRSKKVVYTNFDEETGTLTYYNDHKMNFRKGVTELYDPVGNPDAARFTGYNKKVLKAVIDPSMKDAPLTSFNGMFYGGMNPETWVFQNLSKLTTIEGLENLNTEIVTDMSNMFSMCSSLTSLDLSTFNTSSVTKTVAMFQSCEKLETVNVSSFNISKVTDMGQMFNYCPKLTTIYCANDWSISTATSDYMFSGCTSLVGGEGTTFDNNFTDKTYARPDGGTSAPGYFTEKISLQGDLNGDGKVDIADAVTVLNIMAADEYKAEADLNGDQKIDIADFVTVLNIMAAQ